MRLEIENMSLCLDTWKLIGIFHYYAIISKNFVNLQASSIVCATIYLALAGV
jgi:hypothetical protein